MMKRRMAMIVLKMTEEVEEKYENNDVTIDVDDEDVFSHIKKNDGDDGLRR